jgi:hypothetical protein
MPTAITATATAINGSRDRRLVPMIHRIMSQDRRPLPARPPLMSRSPATLLATLRGSERFVFVLR